MHHIEAAAARVVALHSLERRGPALRTGTIWQPGIVVASEQALAGGQVEAVLPSGERRPATLAGRDPGTNVAAFRVEGTTIEGLGRGTPRLGGLVRLLGADGEGGALARLGMVHQCGPAWTSMAGGRIDALLRLDARLTTAEEGGPVMAEDGLLGISTLGPRRRVLVIPAATIDRVLAPLLAEGRVPQAWLGVSLHPVAIPAALQAQAGGEAGLMVVSLIPDGPAEQAGVLPGDIVVAVDDAPATHPRTVAQTLAGHPPGTVVTLSLLRGGQPQRLPATVGTRPAR